MMVREKRTDRQRQMTVRQSGVAVLDMSERGGNWNQRVWVWVQMPPCLPPPPFPLYSYSEMSNGFRSTETVHLPLNSDYLIK